jgi:hypothetical protein
MVVGAGAIATFVQTAGLSFAAPTTGFAGLSKTAASDTPVAAWTEVGVDPTTGAQVQSVRAIINSGECSKLQLVWKDQAAPIPMTPRAEATSAFTDIVCEANLPIGVTDAKVDGLAVGSRPTVIRSMAVLGDTGCKPAGQTKKSTCDLWPFAEIALRIADKPPDLVLHVGDILYRNGKDASGVTSANLMADFFTPAAPLLRVAPLVMVRGNHEDCDPTQDWIGWFRYFAFGSMPTECTEFTPPFVVSLDPARQLVVMDTSAAKPKPNERLVGEYAKELVTVNTLADHPGMTFLVSHVPFWEIKKGQPDEGGAATLEAALNRQGLSGHVMIILSGDLHQFEYLSFRGDRPPQLILGDGGTEMSNARAGSFEGLCVPQSKKCDDAEKASEGLAADVFGYAIFDLHTSSAGAVAVKTLDPKQPGWNCVLSSHLITSPRSVLRCRT